MSDISVPATFGGLNGYWGQYGSDSLMSYCDSGVEYVTIAFVNQAPEHNPSGWPGTNFAGHCPGDYYMYGPGDSLKSNLWKNCYLIQEGIPYCQDRGVKVLLSIGGDWNIGDSNYEVSTPDKGVEFANFLYSAYGPKEDSWDGPRPFDGADGPTHINGFDFDIEVALPNEPYIAMINRFRELDSSLIITAAPQCPTSDAYFYMKDLVQHADLDALFIQFYNNGECDLIGDSGSPFENSNYAAWEQILADSDMNQDAKLYVGLPAATSSAGSGFVSAETIAKFVSEAKERPSFGGISLWDLTRGAGNVDPITGKDFNKAVLEALSPEDTTTTSASTSMSSTTSYSSSTTATSASTTSAESSTETTSTSSASTETTSTETTATETTGTKTTGTETTGTETTGTETTGTETTSTETTGTETSSVSASTSTTISTSAAFSIMPSSGWNFTTTTTSATGNSLTLPTTTLTNSLTNSLANSLANNGRATTTTHGGAATTNSASLTTSTVYTTHIYTVTKCPPSVHNCPVGGYVTTEVVPLYTTVCPVMNGAATETGEGYQPEITGAVYHEVKTIYSTNVHTITSCPPEVTNCPLGHVTTELTSYITPVTVPHEIKTAYSTNVYTITKCPPEVTNCPLGHVTTEISSYTTPVAVSNEVETLYSTILHTVTECPPEVTNCPLGQVSTEIASWTTGVAQVTGSKVVEEIPEESKSIIYTTIVVPPVTLETFSKPAATSESKAVSTQKQPQGVAAPTGGCVGEGCSATTSTYTPPAATTMPVTAGASTLGVGLTAAMAVAMLQMFAL
ncbi:Chitinase 2 [Neonectria magnoliae]|uniref:Chitinase 2 n=1 Tax=Neonectria magnoliae TaxID=2732573 RepID=A0ABR1I0G2_9HYPO